ncbi:right-handed parallel beta-helix repeat-containing protein [Mucilaginibacter psychrotolerans]|nr:right-handed parallel beta-helix repeat-containing protein [Mucilaginibacter psychrotolerans]
MKNYLMRLGAIVLVASAFMGCTKNADKINGLKGANKLALANDGAGEIANTNTYTVKPNEWFVDGTNIMPGTIIYIPAGTRGALLLKNLKGTPENPIIITNTGGKVTLSTSTTASYGFKTQNCRYFKVLGTGDPAVKYGFNVNGGNIGMTMDDLSSDFEIANVEVRNSGFAGIMAKTDPSCDVATQRGYFIMDNVQIHDNYVHKTGGEGLYIGNSFYAEGRQLSCGTVLPHDVTNLKVYNNLTDSTGCEGIQVGSATLNCEVYKNIVKTPGVSPFASGQNNGIQIGEGTGGKCYRNLVKNAPGNGIIVLGLGDNLVYDNIIINPGVHGIFADSRFTPGPYFQFINNTIVNPGMYGIRMNSETIAMNIVINNLIIVPLAANAINRMDSDVKLTSSNNYVAKTISQVKFLNFYGDNFNLSSRSPILDKGINVLSYGISVDYYGRIRPSTGPIDPGASEY